MISNVIILGRSTFAFGPKLVRVILASWALGRPSPHRDSKRNKQSFSDRALVRTRDSNIRQNVLRRREKGGGGGGEGGEEKQRQKQNNKPNDSSPPRDRESYWSPRLRRTANHRLWLWLWLPLRNHSPSCGAEIETRSLAGEKKSGTRLNGPPMLNLGLGVGEDITVPQLRGHVKDGNLI